MQRDEPRMSAQTLKVLGALISSDEELSGYQIGKAAKLASGTLYPILLRLEVARWVESRWEDGDPKVLGRPRRRFYRVTKIGAQRARAAVKDLEPTFGRLSWA